MSVNGKSYIKKIRILRIDNKAKPKILISIIIIKRAFKNKLNNAIKKQKINKTIVFKRKKISFLNKLKS